MKQFQKWNLKDTTYGKINRDFDSPSTFVAQVFEGLFDCKEITSHHFFIQKLLYIHNNPCSGVWKLVENPIDYIHSSTKYYAPGEQGIYFITEQ